MEGLGGSESAEFMGITSIPICIGFLLFIVDYHDLI